MGRLALLPLALLLVVGSTTGVSRGEEEEGRPFDYRTRALIADDDQGLVRVWDGIKKGMEQACLPMVSLERLDREDGVLDRLEADPPELLFVVGRTAARRLGKRLAAVPRVYVDTAWFVNGEELPPPQEPDPPAAVVRSVIKPVHVAEILRELLGGRPPAALSWDATTPALEARAKDLAVAGGFERGGDEAPRALLHLRLGLGETPAPLPELVARAHAQRLVLISDDVGHWRRGVPILVVPDHFLLGRIAADAGRLLLTEYEAEEPRVIRRRVAVPELRVDLRAAQDLGLDLPVPFLAGADVLRGAPRRTAPSEGER